MTIHVKQLLMQRLQYSEGEIDILEPRIDGLSEETFCIFESWIHDDSYRSEDVYKGYSVAGLMRDMDMNFIAALLTLDWIIKDPDTAIEVLKQGIQ